MTPLPKISLLKVIDDARNHTSGIEVCLQDPAKLIDANHAGPDPSSRAGRGPTEATSVKAPRRRHGNDISRQQGRAKEGADDSLTIVN